MPIDSSTMTFTSTDGVTTFSVANARGYQGSQGAQGSKITSAAMSGTNTVFTMSDSSTVTLLDSRGYAGSIGAKITSGSIDSTGDDITFTLEDASTFIVTGVRGYDGSQGVRGLTGAEGAQGFRGYLGSIGVQGVQGYVGTQGSVGTQGTQGAQGHKVNGAQMTGLDAVFTLTDNTSFTVNNIRGYGGSVGPSGAFAGVGYDGSTGYDGSIGATGPTGPTGFTGDQGPRGYTGSQGPAVNAASIVNDELILEFDDATVSDVNAGNVRGPQGTTGNTGSGSSITVSEINSAGTISDIQTGVTTLRFDTDSGFDVTDLGSNAVKVGMNSTFKTIQVAGQTDLVAIGLDTLNLVAGSNITLTTDASANPKQLTIASTGGGGGGGGGSPNLDGGLANSAYGGITSFDCGGVT